MGWIYKDGFLVGSTQVHIHKPNNNVENGNLVGGAGGSITYQKVVYGQTLDVGKGKEEE
mgnify:CR=1 FL=1|tara:strand:+ start:9560 stop:9736 length:177 start_codon:yes stop_codon:yes gene_type:complete